MSALTTTGLRISALSRAKLNPLGELLREQCREWSDQLYWDYSEASSLLSDVIRRGELSGLLAEQNGTPVGFTFYVVEGPRCSIGDIYVSKKYRGSGTDTLLVETLMRKISERPRLFRIECQSVSFGNAGADAYFLAHGFHRFDRHFMIANIDQASSVRFQNEPGFSEKFSIRSWNELDFSQIARLIYRSYRGEDDSKINSLYASEEGCGELLSILTETIWCGAFLPNASKVAVNRSGGNVVGAAIVSRIARDTGHIGQISVLPEYQGRGIGAALIDSVFSELQLTGSARASLAVTSTNERAVKLYESRGFQTIHTFPVYYYQRP